MAYDLPLEELKELYNSGVSARSLSIKYNCTTGVIINRLHKLNIKVRSNKEIMNGDKNPMKDSKQKERMSLNNPMKNPKTKQKMIDSKTGVPQSPEDKKNHSIAMNNYYNSLDDPGNVIVNHHIAYDFNRPEAMTVNITSRFHSSIHHPKGLQIGVGRGYSLID